LTTPRWQELLAHPDNIDATGIAVAIIADGGDAAYRRALARWNALRGGTDRDAHAGIAIILAESFDDHRAIDEIAQTWPEVFPEQFAWRTAIAEPGPRIRAAFGAKALDALRNWVDSGTAVDLPADAATALRILHPDDHDEVYLGARRLLLERAHTEVVQRTSAQQRATEAAEAAKAETDGDNVDDNDKAASDAESGDDAPEAPSDDTTAEDLAVLESAMASSELVDTAERIADSLLIAAARATPDSPGVERTVLSYWGQAEPLDAVPTANPHPGEPPASWTATCAIIAASKSARTAEAFITLAESYGELHGRELDEYLDALTVSHAHRADEVLLELAKSDASAAGRAVRALADRRRRLAKADPPMMARLDVLVETMHEHGILTELPGVQARTALAKQRTDVETPLEAAIAVADAFGRPTGAELALEWASFASWLEEAELPGAAPVPPAAPQRRTRGGGFRGLFGRGG
jgi:hypothetical protein